jgi:hypothetical protein
MKEKFFSVEYMNFHNFLHSRAFGVFYLQNRRADWPNATGERVKTFFSLKNTLNTSNVLFLVESCLYLETICCQGFFGICQHIELKFFYKVEVMTLPGCLIMSSSHQSTR